MLRDLLAPSGVDLEIGRRAGSPRRSCSRCASATCGVVVVSVLPPGGLSQARYLCKRLRAGVPDVRIVVGRWAAPRTPTRSRAALIGAGADASARACSSSATRILEVVAHGARATPRRAA